LNRHTNIVNFYGFFCAPPSRVGYICEFCSEGTITTFIKKINSQKQQKNLKKPKNLLYFGIDKKLNYLIQIAKGMRYLHQKGIIFRDLKPDNVLIGMNDTLKLTDFGISKTMNDQNKVNMTANAGTSMYMAPEGLSLIFIFFNFFLIHFNSWNLFYFYHFQVTQGLNYDQKIDVFSYGIVIFDILFETITPYGPNPPFGIDFMISQDPNYRPEIPLDLNSFISQYNFNLSSKINVCFISIFSIVSYIWSHNF